MLTDLRGEANLGSRLDLTHHHGVGCQGRSLRPLRPPAGQRAWLADHDRLRRAKGGPGPGASVASSATCWRPTRRPACGSWTCPTKRRSAARAWRGCAAPCSTLAAAGSTKADQLEFNKMDITKSIYGHEGVPGIAPAASNSSSGDTDGSAAAAAAAAAAVPAAADVAA
jgi:hypothetical protein